nr:SCO family protein [Paenibacillus sp. MSJ-34]
MMILLSACGGGGSSKGLGWEIGSFSFTDQTGQTFGKDDLAGKVWIADFVFTNCVTVCSPMTFNMTELQKRAKAEGLELEIVSFSVDPERDKPEVLEQFGGKFGVDFANWHFLTGYSFDDIKQFANTSFKTIVEREADSDQFIHGTSFFLVSKSGTVYSRYSGVEDVPYDQMIKDIKKLNKAKS